MIGIISDTHGLVRPEIFQAFRGCELILHAGDIGKLEVIEQLKTIAPVKAVRGNVDRDPWAKGLPLTRVVKYKNRFLYLLHNPNDIDLEPRVVGLHVIISGHSHKPMEKWHDGILYLNPGSAGPKRFSLPVCAAILEITEEGFHVNWVNLNS